MRLKVVVALLMAVGVLLGLILTRPDTFRYERSVLIFAPPGAIFRRVNDLHRWQAWSPWAKMDPSAKTTFEGPSEGVGAKMSWDGNRNVGAGNMTILESRLDEFIKFRLEFVRPFSGLNTAEFTFSPQDGDTLVTWTMYGPNTLMGKVISLFINCEKMVGGQFEKGLADLKRIAESPTK